MGVGGKVNIAKGGRRVNMGKDGRVGVSGRECN